MFTNVQIQDFYSIYEHWNSWLDGLINFNRWKLFFVVVVLTNEIYNKHKFVLLLGCLVRIRLAHIFNWKEKAIKHTFMLKTLLLLLLLLFLLFIACWNCKSKNHLERTDRHQGWKPSENFCCDALNLYQSRQYVQYIQYRYTQFL